MDKNAQSSESPTDNTIRRKKRLTNKHNDDFLRKFIDVYAALDGHVSNTCKALKLERRTYYDWLKIDWFKQAIDDVNESFIDTAEIMLKRRQRKSDACLIFYLKTKGRSRGYDDRQTIALEGRTQIVIEGVSRKDRKSV